MSDNNEKFLALNATLDAGDDSSKYSSEDSSPNVKVVEGYLDSDLLRGSDERNFAKLVQEGKQKSAFQGGYKTLGTANSGTCECYSQVAKDRRLVFGPLTRPGAARKPSIWKGTRTLRWRLDQLSIIMINKFCETFQYSFYFQFILPIGFPFRVISPLMQPTRSWTRHFGDIVATSVGLGFPSFFSARRGSWDLMLSYGN